MIYEEEWKIEVPWGKLVLLRRGDRNGVPVLLIHGRQDSSSVFKPMLEMMPQNYNYVALDMPGNGLSDPFPLGQDTCIDSNFHHYAVMYDEAPTPQKPFIYFHKKMVICHTKHLPGGPKLTRFHYLAAMEFAVTHLGWNKFHFIGHSMGCEQGLFYNVVHPNRIMKMILLDAGPTIIRMQIDSVVEYQKTYYDNYYENYHWENFTRKAYTRHWALQSLKRYRDLNDLQCTDLLERNFHEKDSNRVWHPMDAHERNQRRSLNEASAPRNPIETRNPSEEYTNRLVQNYILEHGLAKGQRPGTSTEAPNSNEVQGPELCELIEHMRNHDPEGFLSWDNRLKTLAPTNYGNDYYYELFKTIPPTLFIVASDGAKNASPNPEHHRKAKELMDRMSKLDNYYQIDVEGSHDVHYTHPERVVPHILKFLGDNLKGFSKL